jgi:uncharacterized protein involved in exopolysaccharide biosynthesis
MNPFSRITELEKRIEDLESRTRETLEAQQTALTAQGQTIETCLNSLAAQGEMLGGLGDRVQDLEVPKRPKTHFSGMRAPEVKTR